MNTWYLTFSDKNWLGTIVTDAESLDAALTKTHKMKINPGGAVMIFPVPDELAGLITDDLRDRLLNKEDMIVLDIALGGNGQLQKIIV